MTGPQPVSSSLCTQSYRCASYTACWLVSESQKVQGWERAHLEWLWNVADYWKSNSFWSGQKKNAVLFIRQRKYLFESLLMTHWCTRSCIVFTYWKFSHIIIYLFDRWMHLLYGIFLICPSHICYWLFCTWSHASLNWMRHINNSAHIGQLTSHACLWIAVGNSTCNGIE